MQRCIYEKQNILRRTQVGSEWIPYGGVCPHCLDLCNTLFPQIHLLLHSHCTPVSAHNWREKYKKY